MDPPWWPQEHIYYTHLLWTRSLLLLKIVPYTIFGFFHTLMSQFGSAELYIIFSAKLSQTGPKSNWTSMKLMEMDSLKTTTIAAQELLQCCSVVPCYILDLRL